MSKRIITLIILLIALRISAQKNIYAPTLVTPADKSVDQPPLDTLRWNGVPGSFIYKLQFDTIISVNDKHSIKIVNATNYGVKKLIFGKTYYWRVKSFSVDLNTGSIVDSSDWSASSSFKIINTVYLNQPLNNAVAVSQPLTISWNAIVGVSGFDYQIDITPYFNSPNFSTGSILPVSPSTIPATKITLKSLLTGTTYYWRVKTRHSLAQSGWSEIRHFTTTLNLTDIPGLISPADSSLNLSPQVTLKWNIMQNATSYICEVDKSNIFSNPIIDTLKTNNTTSAKISNLNFKTQYFWRVKAFGANNTSSWSNIYNFTILNYPNGLLPQNGAINQPVTSLVFKCDSTITGITGFDFQLDTTADFNSKRLKINKLSKFNSTFTGLKLATLYYWRVKAKNTKDSSDWSPVYSFTTFDGHLSTPLLSAPLNNSVNQKTNPRLSWGAVTGATSYKYQVDTTTSFSKPIKGSTSVTNINLSALLNGKTYYWHVKAYKTKDSSAWSSTFSFRTVNLIPHAPDLFLPVNNASDQPTTLTFLWSQTIGATHYILQVDTDKSFINPAVSDTTAIEFTKTINNLLFGKTYYWRVRATGNNSLLSGWSVVDSFKVISLPVLIGPLNNSVYEPIQNMQLNWNGIAGVTGYECQLDVNTAFNSNSLVDVKTTDTVFTSNNLSFLSQYFWRVRAMTSVDTSAWSEVRNFSTVTTLKILYPIDNSTGVETQITLRFTPLAGATEYDYLIDTANTFNSSSLIADSTFGLSVLRISNLHFGLKYIIKVRGRNSNTVSDWSNPVTFTTLDTLELLAPYNGSVKQMPNVKLSWQNLNGVLQYYYQLDILSSFKSHIVINALTSSNYLIPDTLRFGTTYYWRVQAQNANDRSALTRTWAFTTIDKVNLVSPANNLINAASRTINFKWSVITGIVKYELQYSLNDNNFTTPSIFAISSTTTGGVDNNNYTINSIPSGNIYWRMRAVSVKDTSQWSDVRMFTISVGIDNINGDNLNTEVFPVPCKDGLNIRTGNIKGTLKISLFNILGQTVYQENSSSIAGDLKRINLEGLDNGIYYLKLENGKSFSTRKIVIE